MEKIGIKSLTLEELEEKMLELGEKKFRALQIYDWLYKKRAYSFDEMLNIKEDFRKLLSEVFFIEKLEIFEKYVSKDGTIKYLFLLPSGDLIESVIMRYNYGNTICISSQKGCKMGCEFCASTKAPFLGNLTAGEIIEQIICAECDLGERISNVVFMGIGEPLDNFENVKKAIKNINNPKGLEIGARKITISTCGVVPKIYELADLKLQSTLSISLHSGNDEYRSSIMPINRIYSLDKLFSAIKYYNEVTGKRVSFEYVVIKDKTDRKKDADEVINLIKKYNIKAHVNIIRVNEIDEREFKTSNEENILKFRDYLNNAGIVATIRRTLGEDINAACGQLRRRALKKGEDNENICENR